MTSTEGPRVQAWQALARDHERLSGVHLRELFAADPGRVDRLTEEAAGLVVDLSKHRIDEAALDALVQLAAASDLAGRRDLLFDGGVVNETEQRAALHTALRNRSDRPVLVGDRDVMPEVRAVLDRMRSFADDVRSGAWRGYTGQKIRDVVNIGIGGSDLGPATVAAALDAYRDPELRAHYVSNLDALAIETTLRDLDPERTLFIVASKTFGTQETLANAHTARAWLVDALGSEDAVARHFVAVSTNRERVVAFGIDPANMFEFWDWVGGRYSLWSAIGLSVAVVCGMDCFEALLRGAFEMDEHFRSTPLRRNVPVLLGLLGVWYTNFFGARGHVVLPYDYALRLLPDHLQQLEMESNGKSVTRDGRALSHATCPVVWGGPGNDGQHAYYQLLHQGTPLVPADVLVAAESQATSTAHQDGVLANAFAQAEALMAGRTTDEARAEMEAMGLDEETIRRLAPHKTMPGNRPTTTIFYPRLTPEVLGAILAMYEHKVFVESVVWDVNPFDQWGVELGKTLAGRILDELEHGAVAPGVHDPSTEALLRRVLALRRPSSD